MASETRKPKKDPSELDRQIDENLRRVYNDAMGEDLPDRFKDLIAQLKSKDNGASANE